MKDTFILKTKYGSIINRLSDKQAGVLFKMLFNYVENGANAGSTDERVDMAFEFIKMDLDAFAESYQKKLTGRSEQGRLGNLKRWNRDLYDSVVSGELTLEKAEETIEATNLSLSDKNIAKRQNNRVATSLSLNDNDNVNDNDNDFSFLEKKKQKSASVDFDEEEKNNQPLSDQKETSPQGSAAPPPFNFRQAMLSAGFAADLTEDWLRIRKTKKAVNSERAFKIFLEQVQRTGRDKNEILALVVQKQWKGFEASWVQSAQQSHNPQEPVIIDQNGNIISGTHTTNTAGANVVGRQTASNIASNMQGW
nr:MAG TPA: hypothetical protein [Caudoviricetes sp.]